MVPRRTIKEGILHSIRVNMLTFGGEVFYRRVMSKVDDWGCFPADLEILKAELYMRKGSDVTQKDIKGWIIECINAGLILVYKSDHKEFMKLLNFYTTIRASSSKYPQPTKEELRIAEERAVQVKTKNKKSIFDGYLLGGISDDKKPVNRKAWRPSKEDVLSVYKPYPKKRARGRALKAIEKALIERNNAGIQDPVKWMIGVVTEYARSWIGRDLKFCPYPGTFFNQQYYLDDPKDWFGGDVVKRKFPKRREIFVCVKCWKKEEDCVCIPKDILAHRKKYCQPIHGNEEWTDEMIIGREKERRTRRYTK